MEDGAKIGGALATGAAKVVRVSGIGVAFAYLTALSVLSVLLVVIFLTAHQFQHAIRTAESEGKPVALWKVIELQENWKNAQASLRAKTSELELARAALGEVLRMQSDSEVASSRAFGATRTAEDRLASELLAGGIDQQDVNTIREATFNLRPGLYRALVASMKPPGNEANKAELEELLKAFETSTSTAQQLSIEGGAYFPQVEALQKRVDELQKQVEKSTGAFQNLLGAQSGSSATDTQLLGNYLSQLNALENSWLSSFGSFATMEPDLLTLLLVLAMGTLGGTIHLARLYIGNEATSVGYFVYRPFLGAITALVVFVIARTGVFVIAEPAGRAGSGPLSPFFISFVAIISGLLAEQALASVQGVGTSWFSQPLVTKGARYALRVAEMAKAQKKDKATFLKLSGLSEKDVDALFSGQTPVEFHVQRTAAVWLGVPSRALFTDLPP